MTLESPFAIARPRRPLVTLTPLIDVVFILLVFFMLATAFIEEQRLPLGGTGDAPSIDAPPLQVYLRTGDVQLGGVAMPLERAAAEVAGAGRPVVLEPAPGVPVQRLAEALAALRRAGVTAVAVAAGEPGR